MPLPNGALFAGYRIVRLLGSGGMGEVYLAQHPRLPKRVALKTLPVEWSADEEYRARFTREADLASTLWHPNIVGVHDRGEADGHLWISMDYVDGVDASRLLLDRFPAGMPTEDVMRIVAAVASALDYAHTQGLLHRDVKPANIMLTHVDNQGDQRVLLTDFGIARDVNDISGLTQTNMTVGTVAYSAPEQLKGESIDGRADQYALAATAYQLLTGAQLFPLTNPAAVISAHLVSPPPSLNRHRSDLVGLDAVLATALAKNAEQRFPRCSDFAEALSRQLGDARSGRSAAAATTARRSSAAPRTQSKDRTDPPSDFRPASRTPTNRRRAAVAAAVALAVVIGVSLSLWRPWSRDKLETAPSTMTAPIAPPPSPAPATTKPPPPPARLTLPDAMPTNSGCRGEVLSQTDIQHRYLGAVRLFLSVIDAGGFQQNGCIASVTESGRVLPPIRILTANNFFGFPSPATDATGNAFVNYNPGRFDGVAVLIPTPDGFEDLGLDDYGNTEVPGYSGRLAYYYAELIGPGSDGQFVIRKWQQNCTPSCAEGTPTSVDLAWDGSKYVS